MKNNFINPKKGKNNSFPTGKEEVLKIKIVENGPKRKVLLESRLRNGFPKMGIHFSGDVFELLWRLIKLIRKIIFPSPYMRTAMDIHFFRGVFD